MSQFYIHNTGGSGPTGDDLHVARFIVGANGGADGANYTTVASAISAASAIGGNQTIVLQPGIYTENLTLPALINLAAFDCDAITPNVTILGTISCSDAGSRSISGIRLETNSAPFLSVTGSAATVINLDNCALACTNNTGIVFSSSNASSTVRIQSCEGGISATGITLFSHSSAGSLDINYSIFSNPGLSTTPNTFSSGILRCKNSNLDSVILTSGSTAIFSMQSCRFNCGAINTTALTHSCTNANASSAFGCEFLSGTASGVTVGASAVLSLEQCSVHSTNTNALNGAGTINHEGLTFGPTGTSQKNNITTQVGGLMRGSVVNSPSAGFIGETISSSASAVALTSATPKTITSITLTPGVWSISAQGLTTATGGTALSTAMVIGISTTDNTLQGTIGIGFLQENLTTQVKALGLATVTVTVTTNTSYFLIIQSNYTSTSSAGYGLISAVRIA